MVELPDSEFLDDGRDEYGYVVTVEVFHVDEIRGRIEAAGLTVKE